MARTGSTLIELLAATFSASLLLVGMAGSIVITSHAFDDSDGKAAQPIATGNVADDIMKEMQYATRFYQRTSKSVSFAVPDRNGDGGEEIFRYAWSGIVGDPLTKELNGSPPTVLLSNVQNLNLNYMTRNVIAPSPLVLNLGVVFEGFSESKPSGTPVEISVSTPSGTMPSDLLIAAVVVQGNKESSLTATTAEWNLISLKENAGSGVTLGVWWKLAGNGEPTNHTFSWIGAKSTYGWMMRFAGHDVAAPINASAAFDAGTSASPQSPAVTTTVAKALILRVGGFNGGSVTIDQPGLPGHTAITMDKVGIGKKEISGGAGYLRQVSTGTSGTSNFSLNSSEMAVTATVAIAPAP